MTRHFQVRPFVIPDTPVQSEHEQVNKAKIIVHVCLQTCKHKPLLLPFPDKRLSLYDDNRESHRDAALWNVIINTFAFLYLWLGISAVRQLVLLLCQTPDLISLFVSSCFANPPSISAAYLISLVHV